MRNSSTQKSKSILVVDDNGINRLLPGLILRPFGWEVYEADGGLAALKILEVIKEAIPAVRPELSQYAPRIVSFHINPDKIRDVIGSGGKVINEIIAATGVSIDIEDDGSVCEVDGQTFQNLYSEAE